MALVGHRVTELSLPDLARFDVHLLPGDVSTDLFARFRVDFEEVHDDHDPVRHRGVSAEDATTPPDAGGDPPVRTLRIRASFAGSETAPHHALGVTFDPNSGEVTVDNPLPAGTRIQNFLVEAEAASRNGTERTAAEVWVRVHVHERVERIWLSPSPMTIHQDGNVNPRFALFAEFDDGVVADITRTTVDAWKGRVTWSSDREDIARVDEFGTIDTQGAGPRGSPRRSSRLAVAPRSRTRRRSTSSSRGTTASTSRW